MLRGKIMFCILVFQSASLFHCFWFFRKKADSFKNKKKRFDRVNFCEKNPQENGVENLEETLEKFSIDGKMIRRHNKISHFFIIFVRMVNFYKDDFFFYLIAP
jgi:hypothetical protein